MYVLLIAKMVHFHRNFASFFTPWAAYLIIIILNASKVKSDIDPTTVVQDHGLPPEICPSITPVIDPTGVIDDPTVKPPPSMLPVVNPIDDPVETSPPYSILPIVDPINDPVSKPPPSISPVVDPMPIIITPPDVENISIFYKMESQDGGLGIKMSYKSIPGISETDKMHITISYDIESSTAAVFFAEQFTIELFQELNGYDVIEWDFRPCKKKREDEKTLCKIHACAIILYNSDMVKVASFVICSFTQDKQPQECACENGLNYDDIQKCANGEEGSKACDFFYRSNHSEEIEEVDPSYTNMDAIADFKGTVCLLLNEAKLPCGFCSLYTD